MVVAHEILVSAQGPLVWVFWVWGLGVWAWQLEMVEVWHTDRRTKGQPQPAAIHTDSLQSEGWQFDSWHLILIYIKPCYTRNLMRNPMAVMAVVAVRGAFKKKTGIFSDIMQKGERWISFFLPLEPHQNLDYFTNHVNRRNRGGKS